jgi:hypothetical protein
MPARRLNTERLLAALNVQRAANGAPRWDGPLTVRALGAACLRAVLPALAAGEEAEREALRAAVIHTLDVFAASAPGRAVEVRVPPYAAVQCVAGPRHTRGTPPNVVEAEPVAWVQLAAGLVSWPEAVAAGSVRASGPRSDLSAYLPLRNTLDLAGD